jgi:hypothetical protein
MIHLSSSPASTMKNPAKSPKVLSLDILKVLINEVASNINAVLYFTILNEP